MISELEKIVADPKFIGKQYSSGGKSYTVKVADNFSYVDPVDKSVSNKQVCKYVFYWLFLVKYSHKSILGFTGLI